MSGNVDAVVVLERLLDDDDVMKSKVQEAKDALPEGSSQVIFFTLLLK